MKFKYLAGILPAFAICISAYAQVDTTGIYGEKRDSLEAGTVVARQAGSYLPKGKDIRTEVITAAGLCKMACCNLAESFENSASVTVGYSDAVTGARQIRLLGQSGVYTQMLDENRPVMRGLSAPWGLNYLPGQWLEGIQIAKGVTSVINGVESMTGQINMEHRKPTDETPLYVTASYMNDTKADLNVISALQFDELSTWSTVILAHVDGNFKAMDHNGDGFMDDPRQLNFALSNRWLYFGQDGVQVRFGVRAIQDSRTGGQMEEEGLPAPGSPSLWRSNIFNRSLNGYVKVGVPITENGDRSVAAVLDYTYQNLESSFGNRRYDAGQHTAFANLMYQNLEGDTHHFTLGLSEMLDIYNETGRTVLSNLGAFGEYTYHNGEVFSAIVGLRGEWYNRVGFRISPRLTLKWQPADWMVLRANGGRGLRYSTPLIDNIGVLSTSKALEGDYMSHPLEDSWTFGGNATWYLPFGSSTYVSLDYFHTRFADQMLVDYASDRIRFYTLGSIDGGRSFTNNVQVDFSSELFDGFTLTLTGRYTDARQSLLGQTDDVKPMVSKYKGVLNLQYATHLNKWIFDFTASVNGPCKVWDFMKDLTIDGAKPYASGYTPAYPLLYAQVTRRFKGVDLYVGGENLTNYRQPSPIIGAGNPFGNNFDASCVWGPLMGIKIYGGIRLTIWKTEN